MTNKTYTPEFKAKIVIELLKEEKTASELGSKHNINVKLLYNWRKEFLENAGRVFAQSKIEKDIKNQEKELLEREHDLMAKVGQLTIENDWLKKKSAQVFGADWENKVGFKK